MKHTIQLICISTVTHTIWKTCCTQSIYDAYDVGVSVDYATDAYSIGVWTSAENSAGYELALAYTGIENFTAKAIWSDFSDQVGGPPTPKIPTGLVIN